MAPVSEKAGWQSGVINITERVQIIEDNPFTVSAGFVSVKRSRSWSAMYFVGTRASPSEKSPADDHAWRPTYCVYSHGTFLPRKVHLLDFTKCILAKTWARPVDSKMPSVTEWQQALNQQYRVRIESSSSLCDDVWAVQVRRDRDRRQTGRQPLARKDLIPWPRAEQRQQDLLVRPIDLLHALGRITTPAVTELLDLSSTWAEIRYLWAFASSVWKNSRPPLRLSATVRDLDFHQKTLLSDEFGVGFAAYYMAECERATDPIDVFIARRNRQLRLSGTKRRSLPDYIFRGPRDDEFFVVECKGTQGPRGTSVAQLQRGTEQVVTIGIDPPARVTRLIIGAWLKGPISLLIIDPDDTEEVRLLSRWVPEELTRFAAAKKLTYIGDHGRARKLVDDLMESEDISFDPPRVEVRKTYSGTYIGVQEDRRTPDGRELTLFRGMEQERLEAARLGLPGKISLREPLLEMAGDEPPAGVVRSFSLDGSLLEVQIT